MRAAPETVLPGRPAPGAASGLTSDRASALLAEHGPNEIQRQRARSPWALLAAQFASPLIWLLLAASAVSAVLREVADAIAIGTILVLNALVGFFQEYRAERAILALRSMTAPRARVLRDGHPVVVAAAQVVPGDVLVLEAGDVVAADARVVEAHALSTSEAPLTGESLPVEKNPAPAPADAPLAERHDSVFMGTAVATGTGRAAVTATGMKTELGRIADLLASAQEGPTPLQQRLARVSRTLLFLCMAIVAVVAAIGVFRGESPLLVFMSAVSLAVAAVPEGLPAVVTIALAVGVQRMAARNVLVRRLPAVETLGCATMICTDKTGTLTTGQMAVREIWGPDHRAVLAAAAACCDAELAADGRTGTGDPTEVALLLAAADRGIDRDQIERANPRLAVNPFDADRKRMSIRRADGLLYVKGAMESVLAQAGAGQEGVAAATQEMAARGLRVLAVAVGDGAAEEGLRVLGVVGLADPPRSEAVDAVAAARRAGIRTVMITGDHPITARAIAREMGILCAGDEGDEVVHARATPEDKLSIVRAWKGKGAVVAMTGDGVNDAPALREAHIGIAMGKTGTEVTRESSDMVLADDNFASIVAAVREGRGIFDNIRKSLVYLLTGNAGELAVMLLASLAGLPLPLLPVQLLWINLVTDGLPALALVMDPPAPDVLDRPPRRPDEAMLGRAEWTRVVAFGLLEAAIALSVFAWALRHRSVIEARTLVFSYIVLAELFRSFAARHATRILWEVGLFTNVRLVGVVLFSVLLQVAIHYVPATRALFQIGLPSPADAAVCAALALVPVTVLEVAKLVRRRR
ncbi:MAG TPA: cation-translocating P-type ATPase [Actinomycetota bacterium]|nr:cation-translocating P-type ATPase [Actinomycetota bacterium]